MTRRWRTIGGRVALVLGVLALPMVFAYNATGKRWEGGTTTMYTGIPGGSKWSTALQASMQQWTDKTAFKFVANPNYLNPCIGYSRSSTGADFPDGNGDQLNGTDFRNDLCGNDFGSSVLATTLVTSNSNQFGFTYITEADIVFNSAFIWDVYNGPRKNTVINGQSQSLTDFGRVSLHELGHVLGLDHENDATIPAIMAPKISDLYQLQSDDIAGANSLYAAATVCQFKTLKIDALVRDSLDSSDCRIKDLFGTGTDASYVDAYKFTLTTSTHLIIDMRSTQLDPVLVLTDSQLKKLDIDDDYDGTCNAHLDETLAAGSYLILANTYTTVSKCGSNQGTYSLTVSDSAQPVLGDTATTGTGTAASALITGGATADGGTTYKSTFAATDSIDVNASIMVDPSQVGQSGKVYVLIQASNGARYSKAGDGSFVPFNGNLSQMTAYKSGSLLAQETVKVASGLKAAGTGLAGLSFVVYVGYALDNQPSTIYYGTTPIQFSIGK